MLLSSIVSQFLAEERNVAVLLADTQVEALAIAATGFYSGYADLTAAPNTTLADITGNVDISASEWAIIKPLFLLYVERETALQTEATGMQGVNGFGRNSSEVNSDIARVEETFADRAACQAVITVGGDASLSNETGGIFPYGFNFYYY